MNKKNEDLNKLDNEIKTGKADEKQEILASTVTSETTATTTTVGTGTATSNFMQYGWCCPRCGKVNAPWKASCDCYLNIPYIPPNTPMPMPFEPMPSWPQAPGSGDAPGWWQYGSRSGGSIPCDGGTNVPKLQIYNTTPKSTANTDSPDIAAIKTLSEAVNKSLCAPIKNIDRGLNDKLNLKITKEN